MFMFEGSTRHWRGKWESGENSGLCITGKFSTYTIQSFVYLNPEKMQAEFLLIAADSWSPTSHGKEEETRAQPNRPNEHQQAD